MPPMYPKAISGPLFVADPSQPLVKLARQLEIADHMAIDLVSSDEEENGDSEGRACLATHTLSAHQAPESARQPQPIDATLVDLTLSDEEEESYERHDDREATIIGDEYDVSIPTVFDHMNPNPETDAIYRSLPSIRHRDIWVKVGKTVELADGDFLRITLIVQHRDTEEVIIRGHRFRRNTRLGGLFEKKLNEVTLLLRYDPIKPVSMLQQSLETIAQDDILRVRELIVTNRPFPQLSFREDSFRMPTDWTCDYGPLVCRTSYWEQNRHAGVIETVKIDICDDYAAANDLRAGFRGHTVFFGAATKASASEEQWNREERQRVRYRDPLRFYCRSEAMHLNSIVDLTSDNADNSLPKRRYTFLDAFCGAGGTSRGAKGAGLKVLYGFDHDLAAVESWSKNFTGATCWAMAAHEFITVDTEDFKVDILHLSPPCQPYSPAHTVPGQHDDANEATFLAVEGILEKAKPRVVTLEETFGLTRTDVNKEWFTAIIQIFTKLGFSVRWNVFDLRDFGLPQPRKRLFVVASCPGEPLPSFPRPTHVNPLYRHLSPDRRAWTTVNQAITGIPTNCSLHNLHSVERLHKAPYDGNKPLPSTITCGTGHSYHPSGSRKFTLREIACLQGFPLEHVFGPKGARKQIGNAVPPIVAKTFFETIVSHLRKVDNERR